MPVLCKPAFETPEHVLTYDETIRIARRLHADHPQFDVAMRLVNNLGVQTRYLVRPIDEIINPADFTTRNAIYEAEAKKRIPAVAEQALDHAGIAPDEVDALIVVSCTGYLMPALTAWAINTLKLRNNVVQIPIAQMGCAAGGVAINRARDFCLARPGANVLIICCEYCSLIYQPEDITVSNLLSNALFGDATAAAVVRSEGTGGIRLIESGSYLIPDTEKHISYTVKNTGFHFNLSKGIAGHIQSMIPECQRLLEPLGWTMGEVDYCIFHAGGPRILDVFRDHADVADEKLNYSRDTLKHNGNVASACIYDVASRIFSEAPLEEGAKFLIAGFGPGITAELTAGTWVN
jgi:1,3,6,8-tetrahydroxynaphthalene synthase